MADAFIEQLRIVEQLYHSANNDEKAEDFCQEAEVLKKMLDISIEHHTRLTDDILLEPPKLLRENTQSYNYALHEGECIRIRTPEEARQLCLKLKSSP